MSTLIQERVIETLRKLKLDTAAEALPGRSRFRLR
jgi:hypothetical protein